MITHVIIALRWSYLFRRPESHFSPDTSIISNDGPGDVNSVPLTLGFGGRVRLESHPTRITSHDIVRIVVEEAFRVGVEQRCAEGMMEKRPENVFKRIPMMMHVLVKTAEMIRKRIPIVEKRPEQLKGIHGME